MSSSSERVGRYQLLDPIGMGPCGTVSRAKVFGVAGFERQFAIKRFYPELTITSALASQLSSAARAYGSLEHPRIARMSEFGIAQGTTFTAVELVLGLDAARLIAETRLAGSLLAAGGALALVSQAARAVGYAHGRGLSHLGLAPTNVIVTADGDIKITDFGILAAGLPQRPTDVARLANRIQYLAPEQLANEATSAATDVFALGVIAYELVTGNRTFGGATPGQVAKAILEGPPPEPSLPRPIVRVLHRCLARSPFERFPDARALADALDAALRVAPVPGTRKDIGAQVKATMDRLAEMRETEMSGMVALHVGTGPIPRFNAPDVATLGRGEMSGTPDDPSSTSVFGRSLDSTLVGTAPPPLPSARPPSGAPSAPPAANPGSTILGIRSVNAPPPLKVPPSIPPVVARPVSSPVPKIPSAIPSVSRTLSPGVPSIPRTLTPGSPPPLPRTLTPGSPPPLPRTLTPMRPPPLPLAGIHEPPELQRPSEPPRRSEHSLAEYKSSGRIEINPPPNFEPPTSVGNVTMENMFDETAPAPVDASTRPPPSVPTDARAAGRLVPREGTERPTTEMAKDAAKRLRAEAALLGTDGEPELARESLSVQMEIVPTPEELAETSDTKTGMGAVSTTGLDDDSNDQLTTPIPKAPGSVRISPTTAGGDVPSLANRPAPTVPSPAPEPKKSRAGLFAVVGVVLVAGLAVGAWQLSKRADLADGATPVVTRDAALAVASPDAAAIDAAAVVTSEDAAVAVTTPDATVAPTPDAAVVATTPDAGTPPTPTDTPTKTPAEQLVITSTPAGARVYLDGSDVGTTPVKLDGTADKHTIALLLSGHELYIAQVDGKGAFAIPLKEITPRGGSGAGVKVIKCKAKERYYVFADGKPTGQMCPTERIVTGLGPHVIEVYDAVTETKNKWEVDLKDDRLSYRIKVE